MFFFIFFFFFSSRRRHTRLVSDWSSDVCSSDLCARLAFLRAKSMASYRASTTTWAEITLSAQATRTAGWRSEERRVGKECRSGWGAGEEKEKREEEE